MARLRLRGLVIIDTTLIESLPPNHRHTTYITSVV